MWARSPALRAAERLVHSPHEMSVEGVEYLATLFVTDAEEGAGRYVVEGIGRPRLVDSNAPLWAPNWWAEAWTLFGSRRVRRVCSCARSHSVPKGHAR